MRLALALLFLCSGCLVPSLGITLPSGGNYRGSVGVAGGGYVNSPYLHEHCSKQPEETYESWMRGAFGNDHVHGYGGTFESHGGDPLFDGYGWEEAK